MKKKYNPAGDHEIQQNMHNGKRYLKYLYKGKVFSALYPDEPLRDCFILSSVLWALYNNASSVLILGAACGSSAVLLNQLCPKTEITLVDINPDVKQWAIEYFEIDKLTNAKYIIADAYEYIKNEKCIYDLILMDIFNDQGLPDKFTKTIFFEEVFSHLTTNGILVVNTNMKTVLSVENTLPNLINPLYGLVRNMRTAGFEFVFESRLTNSSLLVTSKSSLNIDDIQKFFKDLIEESTNIHVKAVAYGMLMRLEPIFPKEYINNAQLLPVSYRLYVRKVIYQLYKNSDNALNDDKKDSLQDIYIEFLIQKIKGRKVGNLDDLFEISDYKYYEAISNFCDNRKLTFSDFYNLCRYISTGMDRANGSPCFNNPIMSFVKGIYYLKDGNSEMALLNFKAMLSFFL